MLTRLRTTLHAAISSSRGDVLPPVRFGKELARRANRTLGSPLATPFMFDTLDPAPIDGVGVWPGNVERWVNIRAVGDKAAAGPIL